MRSCCIAQELDSTACDKSPNERKHKKQCVCIYTHIYTHVCVTKSLCCQQKLTQCYQSTILQLKRKEAGSSPDNSIKERLVTAMLGEDGQEVALEDLS